MNKEQLKKINIHKDYVLYQLVRNANHSISMLIAYMQAHTKYSENYMNAYKFHTKLVKDMDKYEDLLAKCQNDMEDK